MRWNIQKIDAAADAAVRENTKKLKIVNWFTKDGNNFVNPENWSKVVWRCQNIFSYFVWKESLYPCRWRFVAKNSFCFWKKCSSNEKSYLWGADKRFRDRDIKNLKLDWIIKEISERRTKAEFLINKWEDTIKLQN